ncbi:uncharacterized protein LOC144820302 [Lissotriton helveticus]
MAPKKVTRSSSSKKGASKEQKKQVTKDTGVPPAPFFVSKKKSMPAAAAAGSAGDQAGSSTPAPLGSVPPPPPRQLKSKPLSAAEAASILLQSPSTSDVGSSQESSSNVPQSTQVVVAHLTSVEQPQRQQQSHVQVQAQVHVEGEAAQGDAHAEVHGGSQQVPTIVVPPEVGAHQEIDNQGEVSFEEATPPDDPSLSSTTLARKRSRVVSTSSSSTPPSDDTDQTWEPAPQPSESEAHHDPTKVLKRKRKLVQSLRLMECDEAQQEVADTAADEDSANDDPVIIKVTAAPAGMQQTDILTLARRAAARDDDDDDVVDEEAVETPQSLELSSTPTRPASIFLSGKKRPASTSTLISGGESGKRTKVGQSRSSTSSGISFMTTTTTSIAASSRSHRHFKSPVWDFFTVCPKNPRFAICTLCKLAVSRGKPGSNYGTGGQSGHLDRKHGVQWFAHLAAIKKGQNQGNVDVSSDVDEQEEDVSNTSLTPSTPLSSTPNVRHTKSVGASETPTHKSSPASKIGSTKSLSARKCLVQANIRTMLTSDVPYERNHPLTRLYNTKLAKMLAVDLLPFSFVEAVGFLELVATLCPKWKVPSRFYFARVAVPALHEDVLQAIGAALQKSAVHTIHLTTDMWTSGPGDDYMCITAHWVSFSGVIAKLNAGVDPDQVFKAARKHATLAMFALEKSHTAENLLEEFDKKVLSMLSPLKRKIGYVSTDNGANVVKAMSQGHHVRVPCLAHCINLVVQKFLSDKESPAFEVMATCRKMCNHFSHSFKARKHLRRLLLQRGMPVKALIQEVATRWNSTFYMLERLHEQYTVLDHYFLTEATSQKEDLRMSKAQWAIVKSLTDMLRPFEFFTRAVSQEDCNLGKAIPLLCILEHQLMAVSSEFEKDEKKKKHFILSEKLLHRLRARLDPDPGRWEELSRIHLEQVKVCVFHLQDSTGFKSGNPRRSHQHTPGTRRITRMTAQLSEKGRLDLIALNSAPQKLLQWTYV